LTTPELKPFFDKIYLSLNDFPTDLDLTSLTHCVWDMAYHVEDPEKEIQGVIEDFTPAHRTKHVFYTQTFTIFLLLLQSLFIIRLWSTRHSYSIPTPHHEDLVQRQWHRDTSYMSLDHAYDGLWNETGQSALVFNDENNVVQITM
jgi:hypothetical protein